MLVCMWYEMSNPQGVDWRCLHVVNYKLPFQPHSSGPLEYGGPYTHATRLPCAH